MWISRYTWKRAGRPREHPLLDKAALFITRTKPNQPSKRNSVTVDDRRLSSSRNTSGLRQRHAAAAGRVQPVRQGAFDAIGTACQYTQTFLTLSTPLTCWKNSLLGRRPSEAATPLPDKALPPFIQPPPPPSANGPPLFPGCLGPGKCFEGPGAGRATATATAAVAGAPL